ncbi:hypothetical protein A2Z00_01660 [Candidatus Gottesmanbacteria bacterium RBG_13_45_10]|uniref:Glycosyltransferase RgtA/B/C/D-like domain-containing protein n=1 Tax=Candidatus Gottesmanbacteria bacterium RBG_13_45_10 TaxID=1798370 RepID=A0A1F5ZF62_9BACT|nr:MAG: hypothetical protein A2Z00_01660 [Candidatus Gottesmanbacteria bacterium RBG_13_45_10]
MTWARYVLLLTVLVLITLHTSLQFGFWKDDWMSVWYGIYQPASLLNGWMHPAANFEYFFLGRLLNDNVFLWQRMGLVLRFFAALSVARFGATLFRSRKAGVVAGILFATTVIGMDAATWTSAYVSLVVVIFLSLGFHYWISYLRNTSIPLCITAITLLLIACISDVWRVLWFIPLLQYTVWMESKSALRKRLMKKFYWIYGISLLVLPICIKISWPIISDMQIVHFVSQHWFKPTVLVSGLMYAGNFFNSLFYMIVGWIIHLPEEGTVGVHSRWQAYMGLGLVIFSVVYIVYARLTRRTRQLLGLLLIWILGFYVSNWLFQPRLVFGVSHRFQAISGVGFVLFLTWIIVKIRNSFIAVTLTILIVLLNICASWRILTEQLTYRSDTVIRKSWDVVDKEVSRTSGPAALYFVGDGSVYYNVFALSGSAPLALYRGYAHMSQFPVVAYDMKNLAYFVCNDHAGYHRIPVDRIYAWHVKENVLIPIHEEVRSRVIADWCMVE